MANVAVAAPAIMVDGVPLKLKLQRAERVRKLKAIGLVAPLFLFILVSFAIPIGVMLFNSIYDPDLGRLMPRTAAALSEWDGSAVPDEPVFEALALDLRDAQKAKQAALIGRRLNYEVAGARSKLIASAKNAAKMESGPYKEAVIEADPMWGEIGTWNLLKRSTRKYTPFFFLSSLDFRYDANNAIETVPEGEAVYRDVFVRTLLVSTTVTLLTLVLGFPLAYLLAILPARTANMLLILVLMSFWTSLLVRTTAWFVLLQTNGPINDFLFYTGIVGERIQLIFTRFGTITAMTHIQLPFTLLPIYSVMKGISPSHVRAARSLGAGPFYAFWRVYFPQTMPGIAAGCLLTFILCLGYYITPSLVGGPTDQLISTYVALFVSAQANWGMGSALGTILLVATLILFFVYNRLVGVERMRLN
jgi:putative spermidine/putrescine transport system permease protein